MDDINKEIERYRAFDEPIPYNGLLIYPIKAKDYYEFISCLDILDIQKNKIPDVKIIQMSYLEFVFGLILNDIEWRKKFISIITLCFHAELEKCDNNRIEKGAFWNELGKNGELVFHLNGYSIDFIERENELKLCLKGLEFNALDFDALIKYIHYQNIYDYFDEFVSEDVQEVVEKFYAMKNKGVKPPTFEEKVITIMSELGKTKQEIGDMSMISIEQLFRTILKHTDYVVEHTYRANTMTDKKLPDIEHWAYKSNKERFADVFVNAETFKNTNQSI